MRAISRRACALALLIGSADGSIAAERPHRIDRAAADRIMAQYDEAIRSADEFMRLYPVIAWGMSVRGAYFYMRGNFPAAANDLAMFSEAPDWPREMIWLFLARSRRGEDGRAELAAGARRLTSQEWPCPAIELFLGQRTPAEMLSAADKAGKRCEGLFYSAQWQLLHGRDADAVATYRATLDVCPPDELGEYGYAITELVRLAQ
jgi:lipoprotein NlpI